MYRTVRGNRARGSTNKLTRKISTFGIMGGLVPQRGLASPLSRHINTQSIGKIVIPSKPVDGLFYMEGNNPMNRYLLSKNPVGSGGVGKKIPNIPCCSAGTLEMLRPKPANVTDIDNSNVGITPPPQLNSDINSILTGNWKVTSVGIGPAPNDTSWFSRPQGVIPYYDDDEYQFEPSGTFQNYFGVNGTTQIENWQAGFDGEGLPQPPHDNSTQNKVWSVDSNNNQIILTGVGAYIGLPKVVNGGELTAPSQAPLSIIYDIVSFSNSTLTLSIETNQGEYWTYELIKDNSNVEITPPPPTEMNGFSASVGQVQFDNAWIGLAKNKNSGFNEYWRSNYLEMHITNTTASVVNIVADVYYSITDENAADPAVAFSDEHSHFTTPAVAIEDGQSNGLSFVLTTPFPRRPWFKRGIFSFPSRWWNRNFTYWCLCRISAGL